MAGKIDAEFLKKHHFWVMLAPASLFVFLSWIFVVTSVADETTEKDNTNKSELAKLDQAKKAARATLGKLNQKKKELEDQQNKMWLQAWSEQKDIFTWPTGYSNSNEYEEAKRMPFGAGGYLDKEKKELVDLDESRFDGIRKEFRDVYQPEFVKLANSLDPMQFAGGGLEAVLKTPKWTTVKPSSEDIWLALEDLWVEREILGKVGEVNRAAAKFTPKKDMPGSFESPIWEVQLKVEQRRSGCTQRSRQLSGRPIAKSLAAPSGVRHWQCVEIAGLVQ